MDGQKIMDLAEDVMHKHGVKAALQYLEEAAQMRAPKGMCVCEDKDGYIVLLGTPAKDPEAVQRFYRALGIFSLGGSYEQIKATCSGNYIKR